MAALLAYLIVAKLAKDRFAALAPALIVTFLPLAMQQSLIGTNDMMALMFAMAVAYGPILAGLASAAVVATKIPLAVCGAIFLYQQQSARALLAAIAAQVDDGDFRN